MAAEPETEVVAGEGYAVANVDSIGDEYGFRKIRRELGVTAFGMNAVAIPPGHAGLVLPRSGLAARHGIALVNAPGLIDPDYRGEVRVLLLNTDPSEAFEVEVGDRVAQLVIVRSEPTDVEEVASLDVTQRGTAGFGSSGR